ncbi:E3 ubiquitin protein ligase ORTHRUS 2-like protein, partial [Tanacetum coccineum]
MIGSRCSGGRDLSGNKRTNKTQSFDQKFDKSNEALRVSCKKGYPIRVVRYARLDHLSNQQKQATSVGEVFRIVEE